MSAALTIVQLYPDELGVAGDRGNVMALATRLERAGLAADVVRYRAGDVLTSDPDLVVVGNGPLSAVRTVYDDFLGLGERLIDLATAGMPILAYGAGAELLSREIALLDGSTLPGIGLFPFRTVRTTVRTVGYIIVDTAHGQVAGFEDNASRWELDAGAAVLGTIVAGGGSAVSSEGVLFRSSIATQVGGPVLPLNPLLTDALIDSAVQRRGLEYAPGAATAQLDTFALKAREVIVANAKHVFSRI